MNTEKNHHQFKKLEPYFWYLQLNSKEKQLKIDKAERSHLSTDNPLGTHTFPHKNFIQLQVTDEGGNIVKLTNFRYPAVNKPKAVAILFHGLNSHIGHAAHIAYTLSQADIETVGFDHRGFGQSEGSPAYVHSLDHHLQDSMLFVEKVRTLYPNTPFFCLGKSMGGLTAYYLTLRHPELFAGAILMAPAIKNQFNGFVIGATKFLKFLLPEHMQLTSAWGNRANRNPQILKYLEKDPFFYKGRASLSTMNFLLQSMKQAPLTFKDYRCPFLAVQGGLDKSVDPMGVFDLFMESDVEQDCKDVLFYSQMWHDIWLQPQILEISGEVVRWIQKRLKQIHDS